MKKTVNEKFHARDEIVFWHNDKQMEGTILEVREEKCLIIANPVLSKSTRHYYLVEKWRLKGKTTAVAPKEKIIHNIPNRPGHCKYSVSFIIPIGEIDRNYRISLVTDNSTISEIEREFNDHVIELPYKNSLGVQTFWKTTFGRVKRLSIDWKSTLRSRPDELPNRCSEITTICTINPMAV